MWHTKNKKKIIFHFCMNDIGKLTKTFLSRHESLNRLTQCKDLASDIRVPMTHDADFEAMAKLVSATDASKIGPEIFWYRGHLIQMLKQWQSWYRLPMHPRLDLGYFGTDGT